MAVLKIKEYVGIGNTTPHEATSWQIALDAEFTQIIDESLYDTVNIYKWYTPLLKPDGINRYEDLREIHGRVKLHDGSYESDWINAPVVDMLVYPIAITDGDKITWTTTEELGWL